MSDDSKTPVPPINPSSDRNKDEPASGRSWGSWILGGITILGVLLVILFLGGVLTFSNWGTGSSEANEGTTASTEQAPDAGSTDNAEDGATDPAPDADLGQSDDATGTAEETETVVLRALSCEEGPDVTRVHGRPNVLWWGEFHRFRDVSCENDLIMMHLFEDEDHPKKITGKKLVSADCLNVPATGGTHLRDVVYFARTDTCPPIEFDESEPGDYRRYVAAHASGENTNDGVAVNATCSEDETEYDPALFGQLQQAKMERVVEIEKKVDAIMTHLNIR